MTLKERLIKEIENLPQEDLMAVQNVIHALAERVQRKRQPVGQDAYLVARQALAGCSGNISDDIARDRDDRV